MEMIEEVRRRRVGQRSKVAGAGSRAREAVDLSAADRTTRGRDGSKPGETARIASAGRQGSGRDEADQPCPLIV